MSQMKDIARLGLWGNNPGLVQLLGLCPLLAVTNTLTNALGLGVATMLVLIASNATISLVRRLVPKEVRMAVFVMIIAAFVTAVELVMTAFAYGLYQSLGIFIPLIVTNCVIMGRAEAFASKNSVGLAAFDGLMMGLGFTAVLAVLGALREVIGQGTLFDGADLLLGPWAKGLRIEVFHFDAKFLVALLPPGAFIGMGFLIALKKVIDQQKDKKKVAEPVAKAQRVRVTAD
ncbi:electron transport complex subunit E [Gallaecimonas kandeliae]|uniref:electron transport complex subunit E n=1 Tax=Gallaecimonas kandeliae TaxID=3029055 RepID=UPI00264723DA|nr:electron transport complex subunit E [Gallaecimonas kandeliae]WKE64373.1 electron transport complex subunit E [Gallaecimonas kandeliae]